MARSRPPRVTVIGSVVADTIHRPDGEVVESIGGIAYTVATLAALAAGEVEIVVVTRVGADLWGPLRGAWGRLPGVTLRGLVPDPRPNPRVRLQYGAGLARGERHERLTGPLPPLGLEEVEAAGAAELALVNCITGWDCTLEAVAWLRERCPRLYLDFHSLALGHAPDGSRHYRAPRSWRRWVEVADVLQCNRAEAATLAGTDPRDPAPGAVDGFLRGLLRAPAGPRVVAVTCGAAGARIYRRAGAGVAAATVAAPRVSVVDPTGAGDSFGAGYAWAWLRGAGPVEAGREAVRVASATCTLSGPPTPDRLRQALAQVPPAGRAGTAPRGPSRPGAPR